MEQPQRQKGAGVMHSGVAQPSALTQRACCAAAVAPARAERQRAYAPARGGGAGAPLPPLQHRPALTTHCFRSVQLEALEHDAALGDVAATAETLRFNALSNTQFVENVRGAAHSTPSPCALGLTPRFSPSQRLYDDGHAVVLKRCGANDAASRGGAAHAPQTEPEARWRHVLSHAPLRCSLSFLALFPTNSRTWTLR